MGKEEAGKEERNEKKKGQVILRMSFFSLLLFLYLYGPTIYSLIQFGCTVDEYYKKLYEEKWEVKLPASELLERKTMDIAWDGGGTVYMILKVKEPMDLESGQMGMGAWQRKKNSLLEERTLRIIRDISEDTKKDAEAPNFEEEYVWMYAAKELKGTGFDGPISTALLYFPESQKLYCLDVSEDTLNLDLQ